jgi:hypothetical protein
MMPITKNENYTVLLSDDVIHVEPTANRTITLPNVADAKGRTYRVVKNNAAARLR